MERAIVRSPCFFVYRCSQKFEILADAGRSRKQKIQTKNIFYETKITSGSNDIAADGDGMRAQTTEKTAYVVYDQGTLYFLYVTADQVKDNKITIVDGTDEKEIPLAKDCYWSGNAVLYTGTSVPGWQSKNSSVTSVVIDKSFEDARPQSCYKWFRNIKKCKTIEGIEHLNISEVTDMGHMFSYSGGLTSLDLSNFDTSKVTDMSYMFDQCTGLTSLDLSNFYTSNVTDMSSMFNSCSSLRLLDMSKCKVANIDFSKIENVLGSYRPLTYVPTGTTVTENRENVVVGEDCKHLVIDYDGTKNNQILLSVPYRFTAENITINREFVADNPHTLYLPFTMDAKTYGTFYTYGGYDNGTVTFNELTDATTTVNTPYLFKPKASRTIVIDGSITVEANTTQGEAQIDDETNNETDADANGQFIGVYTKKTFTADEASKGIYYGWANGKFMKAGENAKVDACRAYLQLPEKTAGKAPASLSVKFDGDGTTGISTAKSNADGGTDVPMYNMQGQRVGVSYKGLVIKNGRKVIVK